MICYIEAMISDIYSIHNRGQIVTYACQWVAKHSKLAIRLLVVPVLVLVFIYIVNALLLQSGVVIGILVLVAFALLPVMPNIMMHVVENKEEYNYPEELPRLRIVFSLWWHFFKDIFLVTFLGSVLSFVLSFTIIVPMFGWIVIPLAIVVKQRDESVSALTVFPVTFMRIVRNFGAFFYCMVGIGIISSSMTGAPILMLTAVSEFLRQFLDINLVGNIKQYIDGDMVQLLFCVPFVGGVLSTQISFIILHFFYGHVIEKEEHPALIDRIEHFDDI